MKQNMSLPLYSGTLAEYGGWDMLRAELRDLGCDGIEAIWSGEDIPEDLPKDLIGGYHLIFYPDWLDLWRGDLKSLAEKYGSLDEVRKIYGGRLDASFLLDQYRADLRRAAELGAPYVVFHVSDVAVDECFTYRFRYTNMEVLTAAAVCINLLLKEREDWPFLVLVENQWWPGFTFTEPKETEYLLSQIDYPKIGIVLDTGHLMNCCPDLQTEAEGAVYIQKQLERHGSLAKAIRAVHLHQSLSGGYVKAVCGRLPDPWPEGYRERFAVNYSHVMKIDRHQPWTDPAILPVLEHIAPDYLVHELTSRDRKARAAAVRQQISLLKGL